MFSFMNPGKSKPAKKGLKIIIVGCGKVGTTLVEQLSKEGYTDFKEFYKESLKK